LFFTTTKAVAARERTRAAEEENSCSTQVASQRERSKIDGILGKVLSLHKQKPSARFDDDARSEIREKLLHDVKLFKYFNYAQFQVASPWTRKEE
jgi:hypothetical protein